MTAGMVGEGSQSLEGAWRTPEQKDLSKAKAVKTNQTLSSY
jgi:hypothetical protein